MNGDDEARSWMTNLGRGRRSWVEDKTQIHQNPNSQYPTKKKFIQSEINPKIREQADRRRDRPRASRSVIRRDDLGGTIWVRDLRNGFDGRARRSEEWVRNLTIGALLDERARSWVFWVRRSSWIDLAFVGAGCWCDLSSVLCLSLSLSLALSLFCT